MTPRVLMVVPTLGRRPGLLEQCLDSITSQDVAVDLVVVAPETPELLTIVTSYGGRLVPDPRDGISGALNAGFAAGVPGTDYVAWLGDDDLLTPGSLAATVAALDASPSATMAYGWCDYVDENGARVFASHAGRLAALIMGFGPNLVPQPGSLMRYADVRALGGVDPSLGFSMDLDLFLRLRRRGPLVAVPRVVAAFRWHADSTTVADERASAEEADRVRMRYMSPTGARFYEVLRWPGRFALRLAKLRVRQNVRRQATHA